MRSLFVLAALALLSAIPVSLQAQTEDRDAVMRHLQDASRGAAEQGYRDEPRVFDSRSVVGKLPRGGSVVVEANLRAGERYTVVAVCDEACTDLDLRAHAPEGGEMLDQDVSTDAVPVLTFTAAVNGPHALSVIMSGCREELCWFAVKVLAR
jgi:hypothetical protein